MDLLLPLLPALVALVVILLTRRAALALFLAGFAGALLLSGGSLLIALKSFVGEHFFGALSGAWHVGPIIFTLTLGAFATLLEKSGGFQVLLDRLLKDNSESPEKGQQKLLLGVYGLGLLCFFDGLANAILLGRVARPMTDALRISRKFLAYLIDSTSSAVACVAFISTWIATQLSLIQDGLAAAPFPVNPVELFFASIPANPYCLMTLLLLPLVILRSWYVGPMKQAMKEASQGEGEHAQDQPLRPSPAGSLSSVLIPLLALLLAIPTFIYLWQDSSPSGWSWGNAFSSSGVPYAMVTAGFVALGVALLLFPKSGRAAIPRHLTEGASALLPALLILLLAWSLGSVMTELGTAQALASLLVDRFSLAWLPLAVFALGALTSFLTGSSWGTMGLLMPLTLPLTLEMGGAEGVGTEELRALVPLTIGAVFGGAVFGDHGSPFSDTTIVSALAAGCSPTSHVLTQLPYALLVAGFASASYLLMALSLRAGIATVISATLMIALVMIASRKEGASKLTS